MGTNDRIFLDAGVLIGAIMLDDPRGPEAYPLVEAARRGEFRACTSNEIVLSKPDPKTTAEYKAAIAECLVEMQRLHAKMQEEQREIELSRERTDALIKQLQARKDGTKTKDTSARR